MIKKTCVIDKANTIIYYNIVSIMLQCKKHKNSIEKYCIAKIIDHSVHTTR